MQDDANTDTKAAVGNRRGQTEPALIARIARQLMQLDGIALDNEPERRKLARWIAANFTPRG